MHAAASVHLGSDVRTPGLPARQHHFARGLHQIHPINRALSRHTARAVSLFPWLVM